MSVRLATVVLAVLVMSAGAVACGDDAGAGPSGTSTETTSPSPTETAGSRPTEPVSDGPHKENYVYLLGGSAARESIISHASWTREIKKLGGGKVRAYDLGNRVQAFDADVELVKAMPAGPTLVLIGISVGRFTIMPEELEQQLAEQDASQIIAAPPEVIHQYDPSGIHSDSMKVRMLERWLNERASVFQQNIAFNVAGLERLIKICQRRKFEPVLLELPFNADFAGSLDVFGGPRKQYGAQVRKLARRFDVPYVDFLSEVPLANTDFTDFQHMAVTGRPLWQTRLSQEVVTLLQKEGLR